MEALPVAARTHKRDEAFANVLLQPSLKGHDVPVNFATPCGLEILSAVLVDTRLEPKLCFEFAASHLQLPVVSVRFDTVERKGVNL